MKINRLLTTAEREEISKAVKSVERVTSGEIIPMIVAQSSTYKSVEIYFSLIFSLFFTSLVSICFDNHISYVVFYIFFTFIGFILGAFLFKLKFIRLLVVPKYLKVYKVHHAAKHNFFENGLYKTRHKTGILIYISLFEKQVVVMGDEGINSKIQQHDWDNIVKLIIKGIKEGKVKDGIVAGIRSCSDMLQKYFPVEADDTNELSDEIIVKD